MFLFSQHTSLAYTKVRLTQLLCGSAGVTSFVKASYLWTMSATDICEYSLSTNENFERILIRLDSMVDLNYWSDAESNVTIIAASIPILRVLLREVKTTMSSRKPYLLSTMDSGKISRTHNNGNNTTVISMPGRTLSRTSEQTDESSGTRTLCETSSRERFCKRANLRSISMTWRTVFEGCCMRKGREIFLYLIYFFN